MGRSAAKFACFASACIVIASSGHADDRWLVAPGYNSGGNETGSFVTVDYRPDKELFWRLKPQYAVGLSADGAAYVSFGSRIDLRIGDVRITPYSGPALYHAGQSGVSASDALIQFRSGIDIAVPLNDRLSLSAGYMHVSNADLFDYSADAEIFRVGLEFTFD